MDRALLVDVLSVSEQEVGNAWAGRMFGLGSVFGFFMCVFSDGVTPQFKAIRSLPFMLLADYTSLSQSFSKTEVISTLQYPSPSSGILNSGFSAS